MIRDLPITSTTPIINNLEPTCCSAFCVSFRIGYHCFFTARFKDDASDDFHNPNPLFL
jgi:hypothetical protein